MKIRKIAVLLITILVITGCAETIPILPDDQIKTEADAIARAYVVCPPEINRMREPWFADRHDHIWIVGKRRYLEWRKDLFFVYTVYLAKRDGKVLEPCQEEPRVEY